VSEYGCTVICQALSEGGYQIIVPALPKARLPNGGKPPLTIVVA